MSKTLSTKFVKLHCNKKQTTNIVENVFFVKKRGNKNGECCFGAAESRKQSFLTYILHI